MVRVKQALLTALTLLVGRPLKAVIRVVVRSGLPLYNRWLTAAAANHRNRSLGRSGGPGVVERWSLLGAVAILTLAVAGLGFFAKNAAATGERSLLARITHAEASAEIVETARRTPRRPVKLAAVGVTGIGGADETDAAAGTEQPLLTAVGALPTEETQTRTGPVDYAVEGGDTVSLVAAKFGLGYKSILWSNNITESSLIKPGDVLKIPPVDGVLYTVAKGENLNALVTKYHADLAGTLDVNHLPDPSAIAVGQTITLVGGEPPQAPAPPRARSPFFDVSPDPGAGPVGRRVAGAGFLWPTPNRRINQYFRGYRHTGIDIEGTYSSPIYAAADGRVEYVSFQRYGYGYHVIINHGGGRETLYSHASKIFVRVGQHVDRGQTIAMVGSTGRSSGTHVHFEIILNGVKVNPLRLL